MTMTATTQKPKIQSIAPVEGNTLSELSNMKIAVVITTIMLITFAPCAAILAWFVDSKMTQIEDNLNMKLVETRSSINNNVSENIIFLKIIILNDQIEIKLAREISQSVYRWSRIYDRDPDLMLALIKIESNFDPKAVSTAKAEGLTQIMPFWYEIFKEPTGTFKEVDSSIEYGHRILALYENQYDNIGMALTAYNRGHYQIESALIKGQDPSNGYATKILKVYDRLKSMNTGS